jgi:hypothetical protein
LCGVEVDTLAHPAAPCNAEQKVDYACSPCFDRLMDMTAPRRGASELLRCDGCGAAWGSGCSCKANARAIGRGERRKCESEQL